MKGSGETKLLLILGLIVLLGGGAMFLLTKASDSIKTPPTPKPFSWNATEFDKIAKDAPHIHDNPAPKLTIVEFADFECPSCRRAYDMVLRKLKKEKPVKFIFRHLPLTDMHPRAMPAAMAAEAADKQGKFWEMYDALFDGFKTELTDAYIEKCAKNIGLDMTRFKQDEKDTASKARIDNDIKIANGYHIGSTPTFIVEDTNGKVTQATGAKELQDTLQKYGITL